MEIKTCEEYVLAELEDLRKENEKLKEENKALTLRSLELVIALMDMKEKK